MFGVPVENGKATLGVNIRFVGYMFPGEKWNPLKLALEQDYIAEHLAYIESQIQAGTVLLAGPWFNFTQALVILGDSVKSYEQAREIIDNDPFESNGLTTTAVEAWISNPLPGEKTDRAAEKKVLKIVKKTIGKKKRRKKQ